MHSFILNSTNRNNALIQFKISSFTVIACTSKRFNELVGDEGCLTKWWVRVPPVLLTNIVCKAVIEIISVKLLNARVSCVVNKKCK